MTASMTTGCFGSRLPMLQNAEGHRNSSNVDFVVHDFFTYAPEQQFDVLFDYRHVRRASVGRLSCVIALNLHLRQSVIDCPSNVFFLEPLVRMIVHCSSVQLAMKPSADLFSNISAVSLVRSTNRSALGGRRQQTVFCLLGEFSSLYCIMYDLSDIHSEHDAHDE